MCARLTEAERTFQNGKQRRMKIAQDRASPVAGYYKYKETKYVYITTIIIIIIIMIIIIIIITYVCVWFLRTAP